MEASACRSTSSLGSLKIPLLTDLWLSPPLNWKERPLPATSPLSLCSSTRREHPWGAWPSQAAPRSRPCGYSRRPPVPISLRQIPPEILFSPVIFFRLRHLCFGTARRCPLTGRSCSFHPISASPNWRQKTALLFNLYDAIQLRAN